MCYDAAMRPTVAFDPDVAAKLGAMAPKRGICCPL
jgi:hypothetical protein